MSPKQMTSWALSAASLLLAGGLAYAAGQYGPGASDAEIKLGNTMPYSGPASAYGAIGKAEVAYFNMINEQGGINGRRINFITRDDSYSPPKTVELVRKMVEEDQVLALFNTLGTPPNTGSRLMPTTTRCRSSSSPPAPTNGTIPKIIPGRWGGSPATASKRVSTAVTFSRTCRTPRSPCSTRTTISARTI
jgi:branched-chain amino acid transport system substrate-binding protein